MTIDPGQSGALLTFDGVDFEWKTMPLNEEKRVDYDNLCHAIRMLAWGSDGAPRVDHVFLERAHAGGMGATAAFNYGRDFAALEIAVRRTGFPVTYIEPAKWAKTMHAGIDADLKPKAKSILAVKRLYPQLVEKIPVNRNGKLHEGVVDCILMAGHGLRLLGAV